LRQELRILTKRRLLIGAFVLVSWELLAWGAARLLIVEAPLEHADAIVVLSGSGAFKERAQKAAELYRSGLARKVILTNDNLQGGWSRAQQRNPFYFERSRDVLMASGVGADAIEVLFEPVAGTYDEAVLLDKYCKDHSLRSIMVVTSAYHSRRALMTFRKVLSTTQVGLVHPDTGIQTPRPVTWWLHLSGWRAVPLEYLKLVYYRAVLWASEQ
jgi:uncharacterized SAM-binding protein YcdF (DUF218 family)